MARLPMSRMTLNGATPSTAVVSPTDYGIGDLGQVLTRHDASENAIADKQASDALSKADAAFSADYAGMTSSWDHTTPGLPAAAMSAYDKHVMAARAGLSGRAVEAYDRLSGENRVQKVGQAQAYENAALGRLAGDQVQAVRNAETGKAATEFLIGTQDQARQDLHGDAMMAPDYESQAMAAWDKRAETALAAAPEWQRATLQNELTQQRSSYGVTLAKQVFDLREERIKTAVGSSIDALTNSVMADPSTYAEALVQGTKLTSSLPADLRTAFADSLPGRFQSAIARGMYDRQDYEGLKAYIAQPDVKAHMAPKDYDYFSGYVTGTAVAAQQATDQARVQADFNDTLAAIATTGQDTGFDYNRIIKAYGPVKGPEMARVAKQQIGDAKDGYRWMQGALSLSSADMQAQYEAAKPKPGSEDYARKLATWQQLGVGLDAALQARAADPAGAAAATPAGRAAWQAYAANAPGSGQAWANATVAQQKAWGIDDRSIRVLPVGLAKGMVAEVVKVPPEQRDQALMRVLGEIKRVGPQNEGRALHDLQMAGMSGEYAALLNLADITTANGGSGVDDVLLGRHAHAMQQRQTFKQTPSEKQAVMDAVDTALKPFLGSYAFSADGVQYGESVKQVATTLAIGYVADGKSQSEAARLAAKDVAGRYVIQDGYRLPVERTGQARQIKIGTGFTQYDFFDHPDRLKVAGNDPNLTPAQKQTALAQKVLHQGIWVTTQDDTGAQLVIPDGRGGFAAVIDNQDRAVILTWEQLKVRGAATPPDTVRRLGSH